METTEKVRINRVDKLQIEKIFPNMTWAARMSKIARKFIDNRRKKIPS